MTKQTKISLMTAIDEVLDNLDDDYLREQLEDQSDTVYRLATLKNKMRKDPAPVGICSEIWNCPLVRALSPTWKHFSGDSMYPVPGRSRKRNPETAYCKDYLQETKWLGQQKRYRFSLIDHLLKNTPAFYKAIEKRLK